MLSVTEDLVAIEAPSGVSASAFQGGRARQHPIETPRSGHAFEFVLAALGDPKLNQLRCVRTVWG